MVVFTSVNGLRMADSYVSLTSAINPAPYILPHPISASKEYWTSLGLKLLSVCTFYGARTKLLPCTDFYLEVLHQNRSLLLDVEVLSESIQNMYNFQLLR